MKIFIAILISFADGLSSLDSRLKHSNKDTQKRPRIYTFHRGIISYGDEMRAYQIRLWFRNWYQQGFLPYLLDLRDAQLYDNFSKYKAKFSQYPSVNKSAYELPCYLRWLAYGSSSIKCHMCDIKDDNLDNFAYFSDYDVLNVSGDFVDRPEKDKKIESVAYSGLIPAFVKATKVGIDKIILEMSNYQIDDEDFLIDRAGKKVQHVSDMTILKRRNMTAFSKLLYTPSHLGNHGLVHFSANYLNIASASQKNATFQLDRRYYPNDVLVRKLMQKTKLLVFDIRLPQNQKDGIIQTLTKHFSCERTFYLAEQPHLFPDRESIKTKCTELKLISSMPKNIAKNEHLIVIAEDPMTAAFLANDQDAQENQMTHRFLKNESIKKLDSRKHLPVIDKYLENRQVTLFLADRLDQSKLILEYDLGVIVPFERQTSSSEYKKDPETEAKFKSENSADINLHRHMLQHFRRRLTVYEEIEDGWKKRNRYKNA